jgi:uncharacterized repeat protein (TIGR03803 family)
MRSKKPFCAGKLTFAICITLLLASGIVPTQAQARKFKVLHTFEGSDGDGPASQLVRDEAGNLYGTTISGGSSKCPGGGCGTAFKMDGTGKLVWLHKFQGANGDEPFPGLLRDAAGNLFGTTAYGGKVEQACSSLGCGVAFELDKSGKETVLHKFTGGADGNSPVGPLVEDRGGNLYGATASSGNGFGTVFRLSRRGKETVLHNFSGSSDGYNPSGGVILDAGGNIYGTTFIGGDLNCNPGQGCGVVFKIDTTGKETVLHTFGGSDGANPTSPLLLDSAGNLYGTTDKGGNLECQGGLGCGVVFELSPGSGGSWTEKVLYDFCSASNCTDGKFPGQGGLIQDASGNFYGTTIEGGIDLTCSGGNGRGVVFKLDASGKETVLHNFTGGKDGYYPATGMTLDLPGNLYGTAIGGGDTSCNPPLGCGTVFKLNLSRK